MHNAEKFILTCNIITQILYPVIDLVFPSTTDLTIFTSFSDAFHGNSGTDFHFQFVLWPSVCIFPLSFFELKHIYFNPWTV